MVGNNKGENKMAGTITYNIPFNTLNKVCPHIAELVKIMLFDNGCVNRNEPLDTFMLHFETSKVGLAVMEQFAATLTREEKQDFAAGEYEDPLAIAARSPQAQELDTLLNAIFDHM